MNHQLLWAQIITILQLTSLTYMLSLYSMSSGALVDHISHLQIQQYECGP
mgnify:CR=1 FL=1